jgi:hypothetical protein
MRPLNISSCTVKRHILRLSCLLAISFLIFFITGFIFYTPPEIESPYASKTMRIVKIPDKCFSFVEAKEQAVKEKESKQISRATEQLPLLNERPEKVRMAKEYKDLLAQMSSILDNMGAVSVWGAMEDRWDELAGIEGNNLASQWMSAESPLEVIVRERMVMVEDVLKYASSQMGVSLDLLAAVAWAESRLLPYAVNVQGKAYYFTSREGALKMLSELKTGNVDIGLFQVNYRLWGEPLGLQMEDLLNSRVCAIIGAMILTYNLQRHQDPWVAIGRYHSGDMRRMRAYQTKVSRGLMIIRALSIPAHKGEGTELSGISRVRRNPALHSEARLNA